MAGLTDLPSLIASYHTDSTGVNASNQLLDQSGNGNHLDLATGTVVYEIHDGLEMINWDNQFYFEGDCPLVSGGSCVVVGCINLAGTEGTSVLIATAVKKANAGNFDATPNDATITEFLGSTYRINNVLVNAARTWSFFSTSANAAGSAFTNTETNIFSCAARGNPAAYQVSTGTQSVVTATIASPFAAASSGGVIRVGTLNTSFPTSPFAAGRYIATKRIYFFNENVFGNGAFTTAREGEMALWGIS